MTVQSIGVQAAQLGQAGEPLVEPGAFFVDGNYSLRVNSWNSLAGVALTIRSDFLGTDGQLVPSSDPHTPNTNRTKASSDIPLAVGFPLRLSVFASAGVPLRGQTFVQVQLIRGSGAAATPIATLLQDYVTAQQVVSWPGSPIRSSLDGVGALRSITGTTPGVGVELLETVPTGARWQMLSFIATLVTGVTVANRSPTWTFDDGALVYGRTAWTTLIVASTTVRFALSQGFSASFNDQGGNGYVPLMQGNKFAAGHRIRSLTTNFQATDQWSLIQYLVEEFMEAST